QTLSFRATVTAPTPPPVDPAANGLRVRLSEASGAPILDVQVPAGTYDPVTRSGWRPRHAAIEYHDGVGSTPIRRAKVLPLPPGTSRVVVRTRKATFIPDPTVPVSAVPVVAVNLAEARCSAATLPPGSCALNSRGTRLSCR